jgi:hypothetical protein
MRGRADGEDNDPERPVVVEIYEQEVRAPPVVAIDSAP